MLYHYKLVSASAVDADTLDLKIDLGFNLHFDIRCRLFWINAPEKKTEEGKLAMAFTIQWVQHRLNFNDVLTVVTHKDKKEKYGRYLADVICKDGSLREAPLKAGHAVEVKY